MALYNNIRGGERDPPIPLLLWVALYRVPLRHTDPSIPPSIHPSLHPSLFSRILLQDPPTGSWQRCRDVPLDSAAAATPMRGYRNRFPPKRTGRRPESTRLSFHTRGSFAGPLCGAPHTASEYANAQTSEKRTLGTIPNTRGARRAPLRSTGCSLLVQLLVQLPVQLIIQLSVQPLVEPLEEPLVQLLILVQLIVQLLVQLLVQLYSSQYNS